MEFEKPSAQAANKAKETSKILGISSKLLEWRYGLLSDEEVRELESESEKQWTDFDENIVIFSDMVRGYFEGTLSAEDKANFEQAMKSDSMFKELIENDLISDYVDGELSPQVATQVESRIDSDPVFKSRVETNAKFTTLMAQHVFTEKIKEKKNSN